MNPTKNLHVQLIVRLYDQNLNSFESDIVQNLLFDNKLIIIFIKAAMFFAVTKL